MWGQVFVSYMDGEAHRFDFGKEDIAVVRRVCEAIKSDNDRRACRGD